MSNDVLETTSDPGPDPARDPDQLDDDDVVVLPWWRNPVNLVAIAVSLALLCGAIGYVVGNNRALPDANDVDVGFLQDMRVHHDQAVQMSFIFLADDGTDGNLRTIAREILVGQNMEIGRMIQLLRDYGEPEVNETDVAMAWMGEPVDLNRMPGLATQDDIDALVDADGAEADRIFVQLMSAHHEGGIHMADFAAEHAGTAEVRSMAEKMAGSQREEIIEMRNLLARSQSGS
jgi:uncharacterized protein (DUF305 family)